MGKRPSAPEPDYQLLWDTYNRWQQEEQYWYDSELERRTAEHAAEVASGAAGGGAGGTTGEFDPTELDAEYAERLATLEGSVVYQDLNTKYEMRNNAVLTQAKIANAFGGQTNGLVGGGFSMNGGSPGLGNASPGGLGGQDTPSDNIINTLGGGNYAPVEPTLDESSFMDYFTGLYGNSSAENPYGSTPADDAAAAAADVAAGGASGGVSSGSATTSAISTPGPRGLSTLDDEDNPWI